MSMQKQVNGMAEARIKLPDDIKDFIEIENCDGFRTDRYFETTSQKNIFREIMRMQKLTEELREMDIDYVNTTMLYGTTGCGKTTFARWMAHKLKLDFAYLNFSRLLDGVLGSTAMNVSKVFRFMADNRCVFMLDEVDCIAVKRGRESSATGGELSRITITLMQELDYYRSHKVDSIILAGTNKLDTIDDALISRFSLKKEVPLMTNEEKEKYIKKYLRSVGILYDEANIRDYCAANPFLPVRNVEADMIRCIAEWIDRGRENYRINHIREKGG